MKRLESLVLHSPMVVRLYPTRIPDNSGAAARRIRSGLAFTAIFDGKVARHGLRRWFPKLWLGVSESDCTLWTGREYGLRRRV